jgi:hypothetical protein
MACHRSVPIAAKSEITRLFLGGYPESSADRAIEIAKRAGMPLKIAAKVDRVDSAISNE